MRGIRRGRTNDPAPWHERAASLRAAAARQTDSVLRETLTNLAEDCTEIAGEIEAQQPGKPKPPGNPPAEEPEADEPPPVEEPPRPMPPPRPESPPPLRTRK